jgi:hypothetical protein
MIEVLTPIEAWFVMMNVQEKNWRYKSTPTLDENPSILTVRVQHFECVQWRKFEVRI